MNKIFSCFYRIPNITLLLPLFLLSACGGNGGGSNSDSSPIADPQDWSLGVFEPENNFVARCENPRTGINFDLQGSVLHETHWLRSWSDSNYLWYDEILDQDPATFDNPITYFSVLKTVETTASGKAKDQFHFTIPTDEYLEQSQSGVSGGYGVTLSFLSLSPPRSIVVAYTEPRSPASANLKRGTKILEVDGFDLVNSTNNNEIDAINAGAFPQTIGETHTFKVQDVGETSTRTITMTSTVFTSQPVQNVKTIDTTTGKVGYIVFNSHIATAEQQLIDAVTEFKNQNINDLIVDLRYNGGGSIYIALELGSMIAGADAANGLPVGTLKFNDKHPELDQSSPFLTHTPSFTANPNQELPILNLSRVFVLTSPDTCSASELVMNGLRGIDVEVIQIGTTTCGKPHGFNPKDNCGTTYFSINFSTENAKGFSDYTDGFSPIDTTENVGVTLPGCSIKDDFTHELGDELEARLAAALFYRENGTCPVLANRSDTTSTPSLSSIDGQTIKPLWLNNMTLQ